MALSTSQYNSIMRIFDERQTRNRHEHENRVQYVYSHIDGFRTLEESIASISVEQGKKLLNGDANALVELKSALRQLSDQKKQLLATKGLPVDYLAPVYDCPDCQDTGYANGIKCHCFKKEEMILLYSQSNLSKMLQTENFDALRYDYYDGDDLIRFRSAVETCRNFIQTFKTDYQNLFFYGTVGTGKSFLSGCIAKELLEQGFSVIYFSASNLFDLMNQKTFDYSKKDDKIDFYEDIYTCDLLIIDDLGTEMTTTFTSSQLFTCLNERFLRQKSVIISSNLELAEVRDRYSDRIFSRITSNFKGCKLTGVDIRNL